MVSKGQWSKGEGPTVPTDAVTSDRAAEPLQSADIKDDQPAPETVLTTAQGLELTVGEIENSNRIYKSKTPKQTVDWYIKWFSSILGLVAITVRSAGIPELQWVDVLFSWLGAVGWFVVGFMWKDRALILLNGIIAIMLFAGLLRIAFQLGWFSSFMLSTGVS